jgi:hypothetical protein
VAWLKPCPSAGSRARAPAPHCRRTRSAEVLRWGSLVLPRTPLLQDDGGGGLVPVRILVGIPFGVIQIRWHVGIFRLRSFFASRGSYCAQDDSCLVDGSGGVLGSQISKGTRRGAPFACSAARRSLVLPLRALEKIGGVAAWHEAMP